MANVAVQALLGLKSIKRLVIEGIVKLLKKAQESKEDTLLIEAWKFNNDNTDNLYWKRLQNNLTSGNGNQNG